MTEKLTVLIVDDEKNVRNALSRLLQRSGYDVMSTGSATRAMGYLREKRHIDCIILDLLMPEMSGRMFIEAITEEKTFPLNRVIILTAVHNADNATAYMQHGCAAYCGKPWKNQHILDQVRRVCENEADSGHLDAIV